MSVAERALARARRRLADAAVPVTVGQLYYACCRELLPAPRPARPGFLLPRPLSVAAFRAALAGSGDAPTEPSLVLSGPGPRTPDLLDYGLPRILISQHDDLAAVLVAADLHMEAAAVVLGASQVRAGLPAALRGPLAAAPAPVVHLLHDATRSGAAWADRTAARLDLPGHARIARPGLTPRDARTLHLHRAPGGGAALAAVPPEHLLRVLRRTLAGRPRPRGLLPRLRAHAGAGFLTLPEAPT